MQRGTTTVAIMETDNSNRMEPSFQPHEQHDTHMTYRLVESIKGTRFTGGKTISPTENAIYQQIFDTTRSYVVSTFRG